jgi:hypothetical protein
MIAAARVAQVAPFGHDFGLLSSALRPAAGASRNACAY